MTERPDSDRAAPSHHHRNAHRRRVLPKLNFDVAFGGMAARIQREREEQRAWDDDPANKDEGDFWFDVPDRQSKLEAERVEAEKVAAPDAVALAVQKAMLFHINEAIDALPKDEEEVRSAPPAEMKAAIERVRRRWKERDKRAGGLGLEALSQVPGSERAQSAGMPGNVDDRSDVGVEPVQRRSRGRPKLRQVDTHKADRNQTRPQSENRSSNDARSQLLERRIEQWTERMRQSREWISLADIADWCAREKGSIRADDVLRAEAYRALGESVASGEFEERGRSRVVYQAALLLPSHPVRIRMTRELYEACPDPNRDNLPWCWIPRDMASRWLEGKRLPLPHWLTASAIVAAPVKADKTVSAKLPPFDTNKDAGTPKRGGGRTPKYNWEPVLEKLRNRLADEGAPAFGDGEQAKHERFVAEQFPSDNCPTESLIRSKVQQEIKAFRDSLDS